MDKFKEWFVSQYFYTNMRFVHGDALFDKDGDFFRILAVQIAWEAWQSRQAEVESLQEEYAETELHLKGQLSDRDTKIANLEYLVEQDKSLIQTLNKKLEEKDKRIATCLQAIDDHFTCVQNLAHDFVTPEISSMYRTATVMKEIVDETLRGDHE